MDRLEELIIELQHLGFRTQTVGKEISIDFGAGSRLHGSAKDIERMLPVLRKVASPPSKKGDRVRRQVPRQKSALKKGRKRKKKGKIIVASVRMPTASAETRRPTSWRRSRSSAGLPGLGKRH